MQIKTIDDLINAMQADIDQDEFCASDSYRVTRHWLNQLKRIQRSIEAKQSKDREVLIDLSFPDMTQQSIEWAHGLKPNTELDAKTNFVFGRENGLVNMIMQICKHLEENP